MDVVLGHDVIDHVLWTWCLSLVLDGGAQARCMDTTLGHTPWAQCTTQCLAMMCEHGARPQCVDVVLSWGVETVLGRGAWPWRADTVLSPDV